MAYVGNTNTTQAFTPAIDYFSGNGSTTAFTLSRSVASSAQVEVTVNNVPQNPTDAFTVLNNTLTFTGAPSSGTNNIYVQYTSPITQIMQPGQGTVGNTQMASGAALANIGAGGLTQPYLATGVASTGPAFFAYMSVTQSVTQYVATKLAFNVENFDTASCYNNTGSTVGGIPAYAFLPNVAGYYQINGNGQAGSSVAGNLASASIYKNGALYATGASGGTGGSFYAGSSTSTIVYLNGSTDYVELYFYTSVTGNLPVDQVARQTFSGALVRAA